MRSLLEHWGQTRRTGGVVAAIKADLADKGLTTSPAFTEGSVEDEVAIIPVDAGPDGLALSTPGTEDVFEQARPRCGAGTCRPQMSCQYSRRRR